jgi:hypothetical protein
LKRKISFIVAGILTVFAAIAKAQYPVSGSGKNILKADWDLRSGWQKKEPLNLYAQAFFSENTLTIQKNLFTEMAGPLKLNGGYYVQHLGFFCTSEYKIEKSTHVSIKFRLGSLEYCNHLEGKK